jgi:hypothetical protein
MSALFANLDNDIHKPTNLNPSLAQWDNYQIYTLVCVDRAYETIKDEYFKSGYNGLLTFFDEVNHTANFVPYTPTKRTNTNTEYKFGSWLAIQSFSPAKIRINFLDYVNTYHE